MNQPIRNRANKNIIPKKIDEKPLYGNEDITSSKLEDKFAREFLEFLGVKYVRQYFAKPIGRYYDFYIPEHNLLIEINGRYYHGDPRYYKSNQLNNMQKKNKRVDEIKNEWAWMNCYNMLYIWEDDINKDRPKVLEILRHELNMPRFKNKRTNIIL